MNSGATQGFGSFAVLDETRRDVAALTQDAEHALSSGEAIRFHSLSLRVLHNHAPSLAFLDEVAKKMFAEAIKVRDNDDLNLAVKLLTRSRELNPESGEVRENLLACQSNQKVFQDLTRCCFIYPDAARGEQIYREAICRAVEYVKYSGICGDFYEFGVLAGWTARIFAETCLQLRYLCDFYLYDSFEGLPALELEPDKSSYEIQRGVWHEQMDMRDVFEESLELPVEDSVRLGLSTVVSEERLHISKGFFSETLKQPVTGKAAIVHLDCDLYSSTAEVLQFVSRQNILQDGCVLMFDDWNCNRANPAYGQRRAMAEFLERYADRYAVSSFFSYGYNCEAFILHDLSA